tara:strand:+ start:1137 stop:2411 length:1275 start_codon:yes stop_codon:yes gene_type:complete
MAIVISGVNNNDKITASDGTIDLLSGVNHVGVLTAPGFSASGNITAASINIGDDIQIGNAGIITATTLVGNVTGNVNHTSNLLLQISGSEKLRIANSGAFGLNGTNYGSSGQVLTSQGSGSSPVWSTINSDAINEGNTKAEVVDTGTDGHFKVETEGLERLRIDSNGKIGINLTNPGDYNASANNLVVHSSPSVNDAGITIRSNYAGTGGLYFADGTGTSSDKGYIAYGQSNDTMYFGVNRGGKLQINSSGAFGLAGANYGSSGQVLTSQGSGSAVQWATLTTGKVLQFVYTKDGVTSSSNSGGWTDSVESGLNVDITPISATSKILVFMQSVGGNTSSGRSYFLRMRRKVNNTGDTNVASAQLGDGSNGGMQSISMTYVDYDASSPFNTSHVRNYRIRFGQDGSGTARFDYATQSYIYAMEIA